MVGCKIREDGLGVCKILEKYILSQPKLFTSENKKDFFNKRI